VPKDARLLSPRRWRRADGDILDALGIKMNFAMVIAGEAFQQFGEGTLGAVTTVQERRDDREPQVSASVGERVGEEAGEVVVAATVKTGSQAERTVEGLIAQSQKRDPLGTHPPPGPVASLSKQSGCKLGSGICMKTREIVRGKNACKWESNWQVAENSMAVCKGNY